MKKTIMMKLSALILSVMFLAGCNGGPLSKLDSTLDYAPFFFQGLVIGGVISQTQADTYKSGVDKFEFIADTTKTCLSTNAKSDAQCYLDMGNEVRAALTQYFPQTGNTKVSQFAALINDIVNLIIQKNVPSVGAGAPDADIDNTIERKIRELDNLVKSEKG